MNNKPDPGRSAVDDATLAEMTIAHLAEVASGSCSITYEKIIGEPEGPVQEILAGLLVLHEDLLYKEKQALERTEKFKAVFENSPLGMAILDNDRCAVSWNSRFESLARCSAAVKDIADIRFERFVCSEDRDEFVAGWSEVVQEKKNGFRMETLLQQIDHVVTYVRVALGVLRDSQGAVSQTLVLIDDVTAQKNASQRIQKLNFELGQTSRLAGMAEVATGVLHNVGNVLNSLNVSVDVVNDVVGGSELCRLREAMELLRKQWGASEVFATGQVGKVLEYMEALLEKIDGNQRILLDEIEREKDCLDHIRAIVGQQLRYARPEVLVEECEVSTLVDDALSLAMASFESHEIQYIRKEEVHAKVVIDRHRVLQILVNLLRNAQDAVVDSGKEERVVIVSQRKRRESFEISVEDNGVGIAEEHVPNLFVHGFTTKPNGHGFGLHDSANAAQTLGGRLCCQNKGEGAGAIFTLKLPLARKRQERAG